MLTLVLLLATPTPLAVSWQTISSPHTADLVLDIGEETVMLTTSQSLGLSAAERDAAINTIAGEAFQGGGGLDIAAVAANLISRRFSPKYAENLVDIVKAPGQYEANFKTSREDITRPDLISAADRERIATVFDNPMLVRDAIVKGNAPLQFRGTALYKNRRKGDYTPVEGKSNFYFDPASTEVRDTILSKLDSGEAVMQPQTDSLPSVQPQTDSLPSVQPTVNIFVAQKAAGSQIPTPEQRQQKYANAIASSVLAQVLQPQRRRSAASLLTQYMQ
jgi:hypothetical protein